MSARKVDPIVTVQVSVRARTPVHAPTAGPKTPHKRIAPRDIVSGYLAVRWGSTTFTRRCSTKALLSVEVIACMTAFVGLGIVPGLAQRPHSSWLGGLHIVLVPAGDDNSGGH